jgi:protein SCO1/2
MLARLFLASVSFAAVQTEPVPPAPLPGDPRPIDLLRDVGIDQHLGSALPLAARFVDEQGREVELGAYFGARPVLLALVYYECPMLCTLVLDGVVKSLKTLDFDSGVEFDVVAISIDPRETSELARKKQDRYVAAYGRAETAAGWHFLVGSETSIRAVAQAVGFRYVYDASIDEYAHAAGIVVATPKGTLSRYFYGTDFAPRDLRLALVESAEERIGSLADQILLFCYHYDPATGRYGFAILSALRVAGTGTLLLLVLFVARHLRREARARPPAQGAPLVP